MPAFALGVGVDDKPKGKKKKATPCPCGFYNLVERDQNHSQIDINNYKTKTYGECSTWYYEGTERKLVW